MSIVAAEQALKEVAGTNGPIETDQLDPGPTGVELKPGYVVFFDAAVYGETEPDTFVGVVIRVHDGRVRVKSLGLAADSADFPTGDVRLSA